MKKLLALILASVMCLSVLAACGGDDKKDTSGNEGAFATVAPKEDTTTTQAGDAKITTAVVDETDTPDNPVLPAAEDVIVDNEFCRIEITGVTEDDIFGTSIDLEIINKTDDTDVTVSADYVTVNGIHRNAVLYSDVVAGKTAKEQISFYDDADEYIDEYTDIEIGISVTEKDEYFEEPLVKTVYNYYPFGKDKAKKYVREAQPTDKVLVDNEDISVIVTGFEEDELWGYSVNMYIVNKSDRSLLCTTEDDVSVNSIMVSPWFYETVSGGKVMFAKMEGFELEDKGIKDVKDIEFTLRVCEAEDFFADDIVNQKVTLKP